MGYIGLCLACLGVLDLMHILVNLHPIVLVVGLRQCFLGQTVHFTFSVNSSGTWTCTLSGPGSAESTFDLPGLTMNRCVCGSCRYPAIDSRLLSHFRAILAVELYDVAFNFGPVIVSLSAIYSADL